MTKEIPRNPRTLKLTIKDPNENNVEQELAIVNLS